MHQSPLPDPSRVVNFSDEASTSVGEIHFGDIGPMCARRGWAVFPQEREGRRLPSVVDGERLKWGRYKAEAPSLETVVRWSRQATTLNVAAIMGEASGLVFALDVDVTDEALSIEIQRVARETLGETPFQRIGNWPKIALIYRAATADELPANATVRIVGSDHAVEVLSTGKAITVHGRHHKTNKRFSWPGGRMPLNASPSDVPAVTPAQLDAFWTAVEALAPTKGRRRAGNVVEVIDDPDLDTTDLRTPPAGDETPDSREDWLAKRAWAWARWNAGIVAPAEGGRRTVSGAGVDLVAAALAREIGTALTADGKRSVGAMRRDGRAKVAAAAAKLAAGEARPVPAGKRLGTEVVRPLTTTAPAAIAPAHRVLSLTAPMPSSPFRRVHRTETASAAIANAVRLDANASREGGRAGEETGAVIDRFFGDAFSYLPFPGTLPPLRALVSPVGTGKTTRVLTAVERMRETMADGVDKGHRQADDRFRTLALMPSHKLMAEAQENARDLEIDAVVYYGRTNPESGCAPEMRQIAEVLERAGESSAGLCRATRIENGEEVESFCRFNPDNPDFDPSQYVPCPFILQQRRIREAELVFASHAFATCPVPEGMKTVDAVVVDESIVGQLVKTKTFPIRVLAGPRAAPSMTPTEIKERCGERPPTEEDRREFADEMARKRDRAADVFVEELQAGRDPAMRFLTHRDSDRELELTGPLLECLAAAKLVSGRAQRASREITPTTTLREAEEFASRQPGAFLREEHKLWMLLEERIDALRHDRTLVALAAASGGEVDGKAIRMPTGARIPLLTRYGEVDQRIYPLGKRKRTVQISWLSDWNFVDKPTLILDATADDEILKRAFRRPVEVEHVDAPFRLRTVLCPDSTFTKSRLIAAPEDDAETAGTKAVLLADVRRYLTTLATLHGDGGVLAIMPKSVRRQLVRGWKHPANLDFMHFGATRGLDWAKHHSACVLVGCAYPDRIEVDGMTAALSIDDDECYRDDEDGTGAKAPGLEPVRVPMRDGHELVLETPAYEGPIQRRLLRLIRDAELVQALGRLRPIHRDQCAELHILGTCVPAGVVVDHVSSVRSLPKAFGRLFEASLAADGVVSAGVAARADAARQFEEFEAEVRGNPWLAKAFSVVAKGERVGYVAGYVGSDALDALAGRLGLRVLSRARWRHFERPDYVDDLGEDEPASVPADDDEDETPIAAAAEPTSATAGEPAGPTDNVVERMLMLANAGLLAPVIVDVTAGPGGRPLADDPFSRISPEAAEIPFD